MIKRNPKQDGSKVYDCRPQIGICPNNCNQCFYNRPDAYYQDINLSSVPTPAEVGDGIVRMNCGHDSNIERELVIETSKQYKNVFFNTSIPNLDFPGPMVLTANPKEENDYYGPDKFIGQTNKLMFVRLRVSPTNLALVSEAVSRWASCGIAVVLTFMAYYDEAPPGTVETPEMKDWDQKTRILEDRSEFGRRAYSWKKRILNSYYCATEAYMQYVTKMLKGQTGRLVTRCGTVNSGYCKDCRNCETYYWQTVKHLREKGDETC